jgi:hypothetical protein
MTGIDLDGARRQPVESEMPCWISDDSAERINQGNPTPSESCTRTVVTNNAFDDAGA